MVDLQRQYAEIQKEVDSGIQEVIESAQFIGGSKVQKFQDDLANYMDVPGCIPCANGTDALQIAMMALDLKPGDEVIVPTFTYVATAEVIALLHLEPVLVDVYEDTFTIDLEATEAAITDKTKAIVPVHLFGQGADMEGIMKIAEKHGLYVIEDTAQAIGADYTFSNGVTQKLGTIGHIGTTSFFPSKNLGCYGDGGAMFTRDEDLAKKLKMICHHGQSKKYYHAVTGCNSRLDAIQAAVLLAKLPHLDDYSERRRAVAEQYNEAFKDNKSITTPAPQKGSTHVFHQYTLKLNGLDRTKIQEELKAVGIPTMVYYPVPLNEQEAFSHYPSSQNSFPITEELCDQVMSLPMSPNLDQDQVDYIIENVNRVTQQVSGQN